MNTQLIADSTKAGIPWIGPEYPTINPWSADGTLLLLLYFDRFKLHDGDGKFISDLPADLHASSEPRWGADHLLYFINGNRLRYYDVTARRMGDVRTFDEYSKISGKGEADISEDRDHLVFRGDDRTILLYQISSANALHVPFSDAFESLMITPDNNVLISGSTGVWLFDSRSNSLRQVAPVNGHKDMCRDADGSEILVWVNAADPSVNNNGVEKIRLADGKRTLLTTFAWKFAMHVSCSKDAAFVESYNKAGDGEIIQVLMSGNVEKIADHKSAATNYDSQPLTAVNPEGTKLIYRSNNGVIGGPINAYIVLMANGAPQALPPESQWHEINYAAYEGQRFNFEYQVIRGKLTLLRVLQKES